MALHLVQFLFLFPALFPSLFALSETTSSPPHNNHLIFELQEIKLKISQLESILEESTQNLNQKSLYLKEREEIIEAMSRKIQSLHSTLDAIKGESSRADERLSALEEEVRRLWAESRKNNFDLHNLESKANAAEDRLDKVTEQVEKMGDFVTEQWIQIQRLEQALQITEMRALRARRQLGFTRCTFLKFVNNLFGYQPQKLFSVLDPYVIGKGPSLSSYTSQALHQLKRGFIVAKNYHHQLQGFIKQELERNEFTAALANSEFVFFLASALITFPIMGAWMFLSS
ncbi:structural maintenance of chromosomes protein 5 isoform X2 [Fagus crenata]